MSDSKACEDLLELHRKEKKEMQAKIQKMKHSVSKGDKKKKKEVTAEIAILMAELDLKHENELKEFEQPALSSANTDVSDNVSDEGKSIRSTSSGTGVEKTDKISSYSETEHKLSESGDIHAQNLDCEAKKEPHVQKLSKAQKRRNKKAQLEKERQKAIAEEEIQNLSSLRNIESRKIKKKLSERNLAIHEVLSDGDCLYKAVAHQLAHLNLPPMTVQMLRQLTSEYMMSHMADFLPFLTDSKSGDVMTEEEYVNYCEEIATAPVWGGHVEVQVLSHVCGKSIEVIQSDGPSVIAGDEKDEPKLIISYHRHVYGLGEHYNSVIAAPDSENNLED